MTMREERCQTCGKMTADYVLHNYVRNPAPPQVVCRDCHNAMFLHCEKCREVIPYIHSAFTAKDGTLLCADCAKVLLWSLRNRIARDMREIERIKNWLK